MATSATKGGASAPSNILAFPQTKKALRHYNTSMGAAGVCALLYYRIDPPANVEIFDDHRAPTSGITRTPEMAMFLAIYGTLNFGQRNDVKNVLRCLCSKGGDRAARAALDFLTWAERPRFGEG